MPVERGMVLQLRVSESQGGFIGEPRKLVEALHDDVDHRVWMRVDAVPVQQAGEAVTPFFGAKPSPPSAVVSGTMR